MSCSASATHIQLLPKPSARSRQARAAPLGGALSWSTSVRIDGDKGLGDLLDQRRIHVAVRRKTAVTVARTGPYDPEAAWRQFALCPQGLDGPPAHRTGIILAPTDPLHDIALI